TRGITFHQLIQPEVQKSTSTTPPRSPATVSGGLLIQGPPLTSGAAAPGRGWALAGATATGKASAHPSQAPATLTMPSIMVPIVLPVEPFDTPGALGDSPPGVQ